MLLRVDTMDTIFEVGARALGVSENCFDMAASNLASKTSGAKRVMPVVENTFDGYLYQPKIAAAKDFSSGPIVRTGNPNDLALQDRDTWFSFGGGMVLGRDGQFRWDKNTLVNKHGLTVDGANGPIVRDPSAGPVYFDREGNVLQNGSSINKIAVYKVLNPQEMESVPGGFSPNKKSEPPVLADNAALAPESLEGSNTKDIQMMTEFIKLSHGHQMSAKVIHMVDEHYGQAIASAKQI